MIEIPTAVAYPLAFTLVMLGWAWRGAWDAVQQVRHERRNRQP